MTLETPGVAKEVDPPPPRVQCCPEGAAHPPPGKQWPEKETAAAAVCV